MHNRRAPRTITFHVRAPMGPRQLWAIIAAIDVCTRVPFSGTDSMALRGSLLTLRHRNGNIALYPRVCSMMGLGRLQTCCLNDHKWANSMRAQSPWISIRVSHGERYDGCPNWNRVPCNHLYTLSSCYGCTYFNTNIVLKSCGFLISFWGFWGSFYCGVS